LDIPQLKFRLLEASTNIQQNTLQMKLHILQQTFKILPTAVRRMMKPVTNFVVRPAEKKKARNPQRSLNEMDTRPEHYNRKSIRRLTKVKR
jgi:hypothetical protein